MPTEDEVDQLLQLETAKWSSAAIQIEELLSGYRKLGETLEDQAIRLSNANGRCASQPEGLCELQQGQEAMIRARLNGKSRGDKVSKQDTMAQLRPELASIVDSEAEELDLPRQEMLSAMGAFSRRGLHKRGSASSLDSRVGGTTPRGDLANASSSFSSVDVGSTASTPDGGNMLSRLSPAPPATPKAGGRDGMSSAKKISRAMQMVRTGIHMQSTARTLLNSNPLATPRSVMRSNSRMSESSAL